MNRADPLFWTQWLLLIAVVVFLFLIVGSLSGPIGLTPTTVPAWIESSEKTSADELHAKVEVFTACTNANREDEAFRRGFLATTILIPTLDIVLKGLVIIIGIRISPAAFSALRLGISAQFEKP